MRSRLLSVVCMFCVSLFIGYHLLPTEKLQATPLIVPSTVEVPFPYFNKVEEPSTEEINIQVDLTTKEVSVNGNTDAIINVTTTNEPKPVVRWKTKVVETKVSDGYPYVKSIGHLPDSIKPAFTTYGKQ